MLHDALVAQLDPELLHSRNPDPLLVRIPDFLHPLLLSDREFARKVGSSSELVDELFHVLMANLEEESEGELPPVSSPDFPLARRHASE